MADEPAPLPALWIVGAGKMGIALALRLRESGAAGELTVGGRRPAPPDLPLFSGERPGARYLRLPARPDPTPAAVLLAVPDAAIRGVAEELAAAGVGAGAAVLHTSGALGREALEPLARAGASVGSLHPLASVPDPVSGARRLRGARFALEADGAARRLGERLVRAMEGRPLDVAPGGKPLYHAAAVAASNYVVALLDLAERLAAGAGMAPAEARAALAELAAGAVEDVARAGPEAALTGPVSRGDAATVRLHRARLSGTDRALYSVLARETLALARRRGLDPAAADELEELLGRDP